MATRGHEDLPLNQRELDETTKQSLLRCIIADTPRGVFACGKSLNDATNPGLHVQGHGTIGLPLGHHDILNIKRVSREAALSQADAGLSVTPSSQAIWEIPASMWRTENPAWLRELETVKRQLCAEHIMDPGLELNPLSLVFHEEGSGLESLHKYLSLFCKLTSANCFSVLRPRPLLSASSILFYLPNTLGGTFRYNTEAGPSILRHLTHRDLNSPSSPGYVL